MRRYLVLIALMFWLGGFTFYTSVAVPVGTEVLGDSALRQGFITRKVTIWLNLTGVIGLMILASDLIWGKNTRGRRIVLWSLWGGMSLCQGLLYWLHPQLDAMMISKGLLITDAEAFRPLHRLYLWAHTIQWGLGVIFVGVMVWSWMREDEIGGR
jgi:hypothetical protein